MKYKYENPKQLIEKIVNYAREISRNGVLSIESDVQKEKNIFLQLVLTDLVDNLQPDYFNSYKKFIKYYTKELNCSKKKKYKIKKQLNMILIAVKNIAENNGYFILKHELKMFYPKHIMQKVDDIENKDHSIAIGNYVIATGNPETDILSGKVSGIDEEMELVFIEGKNEDFAVCYEQITDVFEDLEEKVKFDKLYKKAKKIVLKENNKSVSYLQRTLKIGYNKARSIMEQLDKNGVLDKLDKKEMEQ